jgi:gamma-glutamylcyclotransferase (GGCT)/AIG2-like uncharacterized protein YtfP
MPELLFVYGTLHPDRAPAEIAEAARRLRYVAAGTISGRRYELGSYPGVVLTEEAAETVRGEVFEVPDAKTLALLDVYEDYRRDDVAGSLFVRVETTVTLDGGASLRCWVYVYHGMLPRE